jgi:hypothetical protein
MQLAAQAEREEKRQGKESCERGRIRLSQIEPKKTKKGGRQDRVINIDVKASFADEGDGNCEKEKGKQPVLSQRRAFGQYQATEKNRK